MIGQCEASAILSRADLAGVLEIGVEVSVNFHVNLDGVERCEGSRADLAGKRLRVSIFVTSKLDARLECLCAVWAFEVLGSSMGVQVVIVDALTLESGRFFYKIDFYLCIR